MQAIELNDPAEIEVFLSKISLSGSGFNSDCLLVDVYDAGLDHADFLKAEGSDPDACYDGKSPAWAKYHVRQGKRVFMIYGPVETCRASVRQLKFSLKETKYLARDASSLLILKTIVTYIKFTANCQ